MKYNQIQAIVNPMNEPLTDTVYYWMTALAQATMHDLNQEAHAAGLSLTQMNVLMHLHYRGPTEAMRLAEVLQTSPAAASQMVDRLVQQGLVERAAAPGDRRVRIIRLCSAGQAIVAACLERRRRRAAALAARIPPGEQPAALCLLQRLAEQAEIEGAKKLSGLAGVRVMPMADET